MSDYVNKPIIPSITGYPALDSLLAAGMVSASTALATTCVNWMTAHGIQGVDVVTVSGTILGVLVTIVTVIWRVLQSRKTQTAVADHVITAAATGVIPESIIKEAVKAPSISEAKIEVAILNTQTIKDQQ